MSSSAPRSVPDGYSLRNRCQAPCAPRNVRHQQRSDSALRPAVPARFLPQSRRVIELLKRCHLGTKFDDRMGKCTQPCDRQIGKLVLFALHDKRIGRVILKHTEVEFGDYSLDDRSRTGTAAQSIHCE